MQDEKNNLNLPQLKIFFTHSLSEQKILLVTGGRAPDSDWLINAKQNYKIWCIDHGIDICKQNNIVPDLLLGDFDSADINSLEWSKLHNVRIERHPVDKDFTDTQLALNRIKDGFAIITGCFGGRFDHLYSTIFSCAHSKIKNCLTDERETIVFLHDNEDITINFKIKPVALSLLPITPTCEGVTINNVHWQLKSATLQQNFPNAISNRVESDNINVSINTGVLGVYMCFKEN